MTSCEGRADGRVSRAGLQQSSRGDPGPGLAREERCGEKQWDSGSILKVDKRFATELDVASKECGVKRRQNVWPEQLVG